MGALEVGGIGGYERVDAAAPDEHAIPVCVLVLLQGKLRMLYECFPMAMLMEQAGGKATSGTQRIMDIVPDSIHGRWDLQQPLGSHWAG